MDSYKIKDGLVQLDINADAVPDNLFGVSFHLVGEGVDWSLQETELGEVFAKEPMMLVEEVEGESHSIVTGLSLRRGEEGNAQDGNLVTFYVVSHSEGELTFEFKHEVASVFAGGRKDLEGVVWNGTKVLVEKVDAEIEGQLDEVQEEVAAGRKENSLIKSGSYREIGADQQLMDLYSFLLIALAFVALVSIAIGAVVLKKRAREYESSSK